MNIFNKRNTLNENIAYMGIMCAINVIFVLMSTLLPILLFLLVFILPLTSAIVTLLCKKKYLPIYFVATITLCMIVTIWNISDTLLYVIPSLISGIIFGIVIEKKVNPIWTIIISTVINFGITFAVIPLINLVLDININETILAVINLNDFTYKSELVISFIFVISLVQQVLSFLVVKEELPKIGITSNYNDSNNIILYVVSLVSFALTLLFSFIYSPLAFFLFFINVYFVIHILYKLLINKNLFIIIGLIASLFIVIFMFGILFQFIPNPCGILLISLYGFLTTIIALINNQLSKTKEKDRIINK